MIDSEKLDIALGALEDIASGRYWINSRERREITSEAAMDIAQQALNIISKLDSEKEKQK